MMITYSICDFFGPLVFLGENQHYHYHQRAAIQQNLRMNFIVLVLLLAVLLYGMNHPCMVAGVNLREALINKLEESTSSESHQQEVYFQQCPFPFNTLNPNDTYVYSWNMLHVPRGAYLGRHFTKRPGSDKPQGHLLSLRVVDGGNGATFRLSVFDNFRTINFDFEIGVTVQQMEIVYIHVIPNPPYARVFQGMRRSDTTPLWRNTTFLVDPAEGFTPPYGYGVERLANDGGNEHIAFEVMCFDGCLVWETPRVCDMSDTPFL